MDGIHLPRRKGVLHRLGNCVLNRVTTHIADAEQNTRILGTRELNLVEWVSIILQHNKEILQITEETCLANCCQILGIIMRILIDHLQSAITVSATYSNDIIILCGGILALANQTDDNVLVGGAHFVSLPCVMGGSRVNFWTRSLRRVVAHTNLFQPY